MKARIYDRSACACWLALSGATHALIAANEFQCLDQALRPNPLVTWVQDTAEPETLVQVRRTNVAGLLAAATAIRGGQAPVNGQGFRILQSGVSVPLAATLLANAIAWRQGGDVAVITPALQGGFAQSVVSGVAQGPCGQQQNGPYSIHWEGTDRDETQLIVGALQLPAVPTAAEACVALRALPPSGPVRDTISWVKNQIHAVGRAAFTRAEIEAVIERNVALRRQYGGVGSHLFNAMTVQQAKNREFEGVVVIWPYQVGGDVEHKRRLLYNGVPDQALTAEQLERLKELFVDRATPWWKHVTGLSDAAARQLALAYISHVLAVAQSTPV